MAEHDNERPLRTFMPEHDLMAMAGAPAVYHCHHFNLFLDQSIDDALGQEDGYRLRFRAARAASAELLSAIVAREDLATPIERLQRAAELFAAMGHGKLDFAAQASGGTVTGTHLHYGFSWREKYGAVIRRRHPADGFAAGFSAAAVEVAYSLEGLTMDADETACVACRARECEFSLQPGDREKPRARVSEAEYRHNVALSFAGLRETEIIDITNGLRDFTAGVSGDDRGLVQAFGVFVSMHLAGYYNRISYDAIAHVQEKMPQVMGALEGLLRESGHVCVFNTFGGILLSPEWEGLVGPLTGDPDDTVTFCAAIGRALGFGHWTITEFVPNKRLVIRTPSSYESVYYKVRHGHSDVPSEYFLQGAALAIARLAHDVAWTEEPHLSQDFYNSLFHGPQPWSVEQTSSLLDGAPYSEVVVSRQG